MFDFPDHWQQLPLEDVMEAIIDYRGKTPKKTDFGVPLITAKIVKGCRILEPAEFIAEEDYDSWMVRGLPEAGDIVVTSEAPLGEVAQLTDSNVALAQRIVTLRGKAGILNNDFLLCVMQSTYVQHQLESRASGSTVKGIKQSELRKILLPIPPENEQIEIANHIKTLSNKIELNRQTNQTLEQIAQAIFKSWFVDFEPVKAKIEAKQNGQDPELAAMCAISGKTDEQLKGLTEVAQQQLKITAALFPDALVKSELGEVPEGWSLGVLGDVIEQRNERVKASAETKQLPYVPIDCISPRSLFLNEYKSGEEAKSSLTKIYKEDFIFGAMRPYFHKVCISPFDATTRTTAFVLKPKQASDFSFGVLRLHKTDTIDFATLHSTGSTIPYAKWEGSLSVVV